MKRGTYLLWLRLAEGIEIEVGALGRLRFERGLYGYVGSAFGPGGLPARLGRHLRREKRCRWHIDHLTLRAVSFEVWLSSERVEHLWAERLLRWEGSIPVDRFGCSDCRCRSHLFRFPEGRPAPELLGVEEVRRLGPGSGRRSARSGSSRRGRSGSV